MNLTNFYSIDSETHFKTYNIKSLPNTEACKNAAKDCISEARSERFQSIAKAILAAGAAFALLYASCVLGFISFVTIGVATSPLSAFPTLQLMSMTLGSVAVGGAFGYYTINATSKILMNQAFAHWIRSNDYYDQARDASLRATTFTV